MKHTTTSEQLNKQKQIQKNKLYVTFISMKPKFLFTETISGIHSNDMLPEISLIPITEEMLLCNGLCKILFILIENALYFHSLRWLIDGANTKKIMKKN